MRRVMLFYYFYFMFVLGKVLPTRVITSLEGVSHTAKIVYNFISLSLHTLYGLSLLFWAEISD